MDTTQTAENIAGVYHNKSKGNSGLVQEQGTVLSIGGMTTLATELGDITLKGTTLASQGDVNISAAKNLTVSTAKTSINQAENSNMQSIGGIEISATEKFMGYHRELSDSNANQVTHQGAQLTSLGGNLTLFAGKNYQQISSQLLANDNVTVTADNIDFENAYNQTSSYLHQSDLKIGSFTRIKSPILDLLNTIENTIDNANASERVLAANGLSLAIQGMDMYGKYQAYKNPSDFAALFRIESGIGVKHNRNDQKNNELISQANRVNGKNIHFTATNGNITLKHSLLSTNDENGERIKNGSINLAASKDINLQAGADKAFQKGKQQGVGVEVGLAFSLGAKTGPSIYVQAGYSQGKQSLEGTYYKNSNLDAATVNINVGNDLTLKGATVKGNTINAYVENNLHIESLQDVQKSKSSSGGANLQVEGGLGSAWSASVSGNYAKGSSNYQQVMEQSGLFAGDGGYHVAADNVHLKGAAIVSTATKENNALIADKFSFEDIQNISAGKATALGGSMGMPYGRDQRSEENKAGDDKYGRNAELEKNKDRAPEDQVTFDKANPNQKEASKFGLGTGMNDVHSLDLYAAAKIIGSALLSNSKKSQSSHSTTKSVISDGLFTIGSSEGKQAINAITKDNQESNQVLSIVDGNKLKEKVEANSQANQQLLGFALHGTDEAYRTMFIDDHRMLTYVIGKDGEPVRDQQLLNKIYDEAVAVGEDPDAYLKAQQEKGRNIYKLKEVSDQERDKLQKVTYIDPITGKAETKYVVAFNGIFNDENAAAKFAAQNYVATKGEDGKLSQRIFENRYFVHHPEASNAFSELLVAAYEKMFETSFGKLFSMDNSSLQAMDLMKQYGKDDLYIGAHSRGTLTVTNALNALNTQKNRDNKILSNTTVKMVGPAADVAEADNTLSLLQTGQSRNTANGSVRIENHESDPVGSIPILLGGNPSTMNDNVNKYWIAHKLMHMVSDIHSSVHNCHGLGQKQCVTDGYRKKGDLIMNKEKTIFELNKK